MERVNVKMKILQVIPSFALAGAERMCQTLSCELHNAGREVVVVSLYSQKTSITDQIEEKGIKLIFLDKKSGFDPSVIRKLKKVIKEERPDIIHTHLGGFEYAAFASFFSDVKIIHTVHNVAKAECCGNRKKIREYFVSRKKCCMVALSDGIALTMSEYYKLNIKDIPVARNGIDITNCVPKNNYSLNDNIKIINIGRLVSQKNHLCLIDAFEIFLKKYPNAKLFLIGDGEERLSIENHISQKKLTENVVLLGLKDKVYSYLNEADMFVLSSTYEGFPMVIIEAMGTGLPIVSTDVGGISDALINEQNSILTAPNADEIANAMIRFAESEELREKYGKEALKDSDKFSSRKMMEDYLKVYSAVIKK